MAHGEAVGVAREEERRQVRPSVGEAAGSVPPVFGALPRGQRLPRERRVGIARDLAWPLLRGVLRGIGGPFVREMTMKRTLESNATPARRQKGSRPRAGHTSASLEGTQAAHRRKWSRNLVGERNEPLDNAGLARANQYSVRSVFRLFTTIFTSPSRRGPTPTDIELLVQNRGPQGRQRAGRQVGGRRIIARLGPLGLLRAPAAQAVPAWTPWPLPSPRFRSRAALRRNAKDGSRFSPDPPKWISFRRKRLVLTTGAFPSPCGPAGAGGFPLIFGKSLTCSVAYSGNMLLNLGCAMFHVCDRAARAFRSASCDLTAPVVISSLSMKLKSPTRIVLTDLSG